VALAALPPLAAVALSCGGTGAPEGVNRTCFFFFFFLGLRGGMPGPARCWAGAPAGAKDGVPGGRVVVVVVACARGGCASGWSAWARAALVPVVVAKVTVRAAVGRT